MGTRGYSFGLGVVVRKADGIAGVPGSAGEFAWGSHAGSFFWVDPKEQLVVVYQTQAPTPDRVHYRRLVKQLVYQAIIN
jgi:CubicO group peptidase (beta-lactamase class C family)